MFCKAYDISVIEQESLDCTTPDVLHKHSLSSARKHLLQQLCILSLVFCHAIDPLASVVALGVQLLPAMDLHMSLLRDQQVLAAALPLYHHNCKHSLLALQVSTLRRGCAAWSHWEHIEWQNSCGDCDAPEFGHQQTQLQ